MGKPLARALVWIASSIAQQFIVRLKQQHADLRAVDWLQASQTVDSTLSVRESFFDSA
jgi:hypothetical protein